MCEQVSRRKACPRSAVGLQSAIASQSAISNAVSPASFLGVTFSYEIETTAGSARAGVFSTPHGPVETPAFMPVRTLATVKALDPEHLVERGAAMILGNACHLHRRPGDDIVREMGGLHPFMGWHRPILTDSGGF